MPLVSCIMPTRDRRRYVPLAIAGFLRQDHPAKELVVVDSGTDPVADLIPAGVPVRYHRVAGPIPVGSARNIACDLAVGTLIVHWDDDDWQCPDRLSRQVAALAPGRADICGTTSALYYRAVDETAWRFAWPAGRPRWFSGQALAYRRELWADTPFYDLEQGEDHAFVAKTAARSRAVALAGDLLVAMAHPHNTVPKTDRNIYCSPAPLTEITDRLGPDLAAYRAAGGGLT